MKNKILLYCCILCLQIQAQDYQGVDEFHAHGGNFIGLITSTDGIHWKKARHYVVCKKEIPLTDGTIMKVDRMERPFLYLENGKPTMLSFGVKKGNNAFIVFFNLKQTTK
jgi:alpha-L-fucosidase